MDRKDVDNTVVCTQTAKAGSADLFATMPWVARLPKNSKGPDCEGHSFGQGRKCKRKATLLHVDLDGALRYFCSTHLRDERLSQWHWLYAENDPQMKRVHKFFDDHVEWSEQAKADLAKYNAQI